MMHWDLRSDLFFAVSGDRGILLDLAAERYLALPDRFTRALDRLVTNQADATDQPAIVELAQRSILLTAGGGDPPTSLPAVLPAVGHEPRGEGRAGPVLALSALVAQHRAAHDLKRVTLRVLRGEFSKSIPTTLLQRVGHRPTIPDIAVSFALAARFSRAGDRCLMRSLAFARLCRSHGHRVHIVFGVRAAPFAAHCWVQRGDEVLNDRVEEIAPFTPIMVW